jgi:hypothetical protein
MRNQYFRRRLTCLFWTYRIRAANTDSNMPLEFEICRIHTIEQRITHSTRSVKPFVASTNVHSAGWLRHLSEVMAKICGILHWKATAKKEDLLWHVNSWGWNVSLLTYIAHITFRPIRPCIMVLFLECGCKFNANRHPAIFAVTSVKMYSNCAA